MVLVLSYIVEGLSNALKLPARPIDSCKHEHLRREVALNVYLKQSGRYLFENRILPVSSR
jgi:hypothetical protein